MRFEAQLLLFRGNRPGEMRGRPGEMRDKPRAPWLIPGGAVR